PKLDIGQVITELGVGEALVSFLDEKGTPRMVERAFILPPASQIGPISPDERKAAMSRSVVAGVYEKTIDRESAYEKLTQRTSTTARPADEDNDAGIPAPRIPGGRAPSAPAEAPSDSGGGMFGDVLGGIFGKPGKRDTAVQAMVKSAARSIGSQVGREIIRGVLGSILKRR
ncbi:MAG TPA: helicase HerA-like domain-containing protein, partial [Pseudoduganella sp.]